MKKLLKLYPELKKEILNFESYFRDLKKFIKITLPAHPAYDKKGDVPILLKHFINVIHLRLIEQISLIRTGLKTQNTETYTVLRAALETVAAMAYVGDKVQSEYLLENYENAWTTLKRALMGGRTKSIGFAKNEVIEEETDKSVNVLTYIDKATKLISKELEKYNGGNQKEDSDYFMSRYEFISEFTHPNYNALEVYWKIEDDKISFAKLGKVLSSENLGIILHTLLPLIPIYLLFLKRAYKFQIEISKGKNDYRSS